MSIYIFSMQIRACTKVTSDFMKRNGRNTSQNVPGSHRCLQLLLGYLFLLLLMCIGSDFLASLLANDRERGKAQPGKTDI